MVGLLSQFKPSVHSFGLRSQQQELRLCGDAVQWMAAFAQGQFGPVTRVVSQVDRTGCGIMIATDGFLLWDVLLSGGVE
eukprot:6485091-Amphidinium_carterae.2